MTLMGVARKAYAAGLIDKIPPSPVYVTGSRRSYKNTDIRANIKEVVSTYFKGTDGKPIELEDFHVELLEMMFGGGKWVVNWPTDHGKSMVVTFLFPLLSLMENPNETHIICGANVADSKSRVQTLELEIETNEHLTRDFPGLKRPSRKEGRRWSATMFDVAGRTINNRNPSVYAASTGGKDIRGRRGKLIMDDIEGIEAQTSPTERSKLLTWVRQEAWRCYEDRAETPRPLLIAVGTPFDPNSIYFSLELQGWEARRFSAYKREEKIVHPKSGSEQWLVEYTWPRKAEKVKEAHDTMEKAQFAIQYRMDPTGGDPSRLSSQQILELMKTGKFTAEQSATFVSLDPASDSSNRRADYAGVSVAKVTWLLGEDLPSVAVLEAIKVTSGAKEQIDLCARLSSDYEGCPVIVETNAMQRTYAELFQLWHPHVRVIPYNTTRDKKLHQKYGLTILSTLLRHGRLLVPESKLEEDGVLALVQEIKDLGQPQQHDHIACSVWFSIRHMYEQARAAPVFTRTIGPKTFGNAGPLNWRSWRSG